MPAEELRMAPETLALVLVWVEGKETATGRTAARLASYGETVRPLVPGGWVRLPLAETLGSSCP